MAHTDKHGKWQVASLLLTEESRLELTNAACVRVLSSQNTREQEFKGELTLFHSHQLGKPPSFKLRVFPVYQVNGVETAAEERRLFHHDIYLPKDTVWRFLTNKLKFSTNSRKRVWLTDVNFDSSANLVFLTLFVPLGDGDGHIQEAFGIALVHANELCMKQ